MKRVIVFDERDVAKYMVQVARMDVLIEMGAMSIPHTRNNKELAKILTDMLNADTWRKRFKMLLDEASKQGVPTPSMELILEVRRELGEDV